MNFKQQMAEDLKIFYNADEFAIAVLYNGVTIQALNVDDMEVSDTEQFVLSFISSDVANISQGSQMSIDDIVYEVSNFDFKDNSKLETLIALNKV